MASFTSAIELGVDVIECDVHLTTDGRLAVIHDHTLERTTNGSGLVGRLSSAELTGLDAGKGERIPLLEEVLELARGRVGVAIEVKSLPILYPGLEEVLVRVVRDAEMVEDVAVISFDHRVVRRVRGLDDRILGGVLLAGRPLLIPELLAFAGAEVYSPHWSYVDRETVHEVHAAGAAVGVWTVDDTMVLEQCQELGLDAVYTNRPREMLAALGRATA